MQQSVLTWSTYQIYDSEIYNEHRDKKTYTTMIPVNDVNRVMAKSPYGTLFFIKTSHLTDQAHQARSRLIENKSSSLVHQSRVRRQVI